MHGIDTFTLKTLEGSVKRRMEQIANEEKEKWIDEFRKELDQLRQGYENMFNDAAKKLYEKYVDKIEDGVAKTAGDALLDIANDVHVYIQSQPETCNNTTLLRIG